MGKSNRDVPFNPDLTSPQVSTGDSPEPLALKAQRPRRGSIRTIRGTRKNDAIDTSSSARVRVFARGGNDSLIVGSRTTAYGEGGNDALNSCGNTAGSSRNRLYGGRGNDLLFAGTGDSLSGDAGRDQLWAGQGSRLRGGQGADLFWIADGGFPLAPNTITDFNRRQDKIVIRNLPGVSTFSDLSLVQVRRNTQIRAGTQTIAILRNVRAKQLKSRHFIISSPGSPGNQLPVDNTAGDRTPGSATVIAGNITGATVAPTTYSFTVAYRDNTAIAVSSLGTGDITVTGPNGFSQTATLVGVDISTPGTPRNAAYQITVPGTTWNAADNGLYTISLGAEQVFDVAGNAIAPGTIGSFSVTIPSGGTIASGERPSVVSSPLANATNVDRRAAINLNSLKFVGVGQGVDPATLNSSTVQLYRTRDNAFVPSNINTSGGGDTIIVQPIVALDANTQYTLRLTEGVRDLGGRSFLPYSLTFTTGTTLTPSTGLNFDQSVVATGVPVSSLVMSPDNQFLYATGQDGQLRRWRVGADGSLSGLQTFAGFTSPSILMGIAFDPTNPNVIWLARNSVWSDDFTGKIVKLTLDDGSSFTGTVQNYVVGLPRSSGFHLSNSLRFGPDGNLYLSQGSNTSTGAPDTAWGLRPERLLTAAILQINPNLTPPAGGFNIQTENYTINDRTIPGNYNPFAPGAPVIPYATGLRNVYDFVFHSNGTLYAPVNGAGGGGLAPDNPNTPANEALTRVDARPDLLFRIRQGSYYGHPNAARGQYIIAGGNPTAGVDRDEIVGVPGVNGYATGTLPDPNYDPSIFNFGANRAPTGVIEYRSNTFGGRLRNRILVTEYSAGDDIVVLDLDSSGNVAASGILAGGTINPDWRMTDPIDLVENTANGNLYVAELFPQNGNLTGSIRLLRPA